MRIRAGIPRGLRKPDAILAGYKYLRANSYGGTRITCFPGTEASKSSTFGRGVRKGVGVAPFCTYISCKQVLLFVNHLQILGMGERKYYFIL